MVKYNWKEIKKQYVEAPDEESRPTYEELATQHGCNPVNLRRRAAKEDWTFEAERFIQTIEIQRQEKKSSSLAGEQAELDARIYRLAKLGLSQVENNFQLAVGQMEPMSTRALDDLAKALERFQKISKTALGEDPKLKLQIDYSTLSDEQLQRLADGEDPRNVVPG